MDLLKSEVVSTTFGFKKKMNTLKCMVKESNRNPLHILKIFFITQTMDAKLERMCGQMNCVKADLCNCLRGQPLEHNLYIGEERKYMQLLRRGVYLYENFSFTRVLLRPI